MIESSRMLELHRLAKSLFDGDNEKANTMLTLLETFTFPEIVSSPDFTNLKMELPEETCKWCFEGECLVRMPDSMFLCKGKCSLYEEREQNEIRN
jgi:hypothetical protein